MEFSLVRPIDAFLYLEEVPLFDKDPGSGDEASPSELLLQLVHLHKTKQNKKKAQITRDRQTPKSSLGIILHTTTGSA